MSSFFDLDRYSYELTFKKTDSHGYQSGGLMLADEVSKLCIEYEDQIKNLEHQVGELEDQVFELTRQLSGKE
jgi:hypothetical protein